MASDTAQQASIDYPKLLYNATNLQDGYTHNLTFTNAGNQTFAFDYAIIEESMTISRKLHLALSSLPDVVLLPSNNTAKLNGVTTSNSFAIATA